VHGDRQFESSQVGITLGGQALIGELPAFETNPLVEIRS
jgi:hypothetical protein